MGGCGTTVRGTVCVCVCVCGLSNREVMQSSFMVRFHTFSDRICFVQYNYFEWGQLLSRASSCTHSVSGKGFDSVADPGIVLGRVHY